jgi:hypothetical protein
MQRSEKVKSAIGNALGITAPQELLLRASILKTPEAVSAWKAFKESVELDSIDTASLRMLPLLYRNLIFHGVEDPEMDRLKGVYRLTWYKNQMLFHRMQSVLAIFHKANIRTMILKGAALSLTFYKDRGVRPMADFDVMVTAKDLQPAIGLLNNAGWKAFETRPLNSLTLKVRHAHSFRDDKSNQFDLHWHLLPEFCTEDCDNDFWDKAVAFNFDGILISTLCVTDHLFHVLVHGVGWSAVSSMRWVADAAVIISEAGPSIDWSRLVKLARERSLSLSLKSSLNYLRQFLGISVPEEVLGELEATPVSEFEVKAFYAKINGNRFTGMLLSDFFRYLIYAHPESNINFWDRTVIFTQFLRYYWGKDSFWQLPGPMILKMRRRISFKLNENRASA